jgi:peroxiredoxin
MKVKLPKAAVILAFLVVANSLQAQKKKDNFELTGTVRGAAAGKHLYVQYTANDGRKITDSLAIVNNAFTYSGYTEIPVNVNFYNNPGLENYGPSWIEVFIEPGKMTMTTDFTDLSKAQVEGSQTQKERDELKKQLEPMQTALDSLKKLYSPFVEKKKVTKNRDTLRALDQKIGEWHQLIEKERDRGLKTELQFFDKHSSSYLAPEILSMRLDQAAGMRNIPGILATYKKLGASAKMGRTGKLLSDKIASLEGSAVGKPAAAFSIKDADEKVVSLADYKDKRYVLLHFWSSWSEPCRVEFPKLKVLYTKYHDKGLDFIGFSEDKNAVSWRKSVDKEGIDIWKQTLMSAATTTDLKQKYFVTMIPTKILIDPKGNIIGRWSGSSDENEASLEKKLEEIFAKQP